MTQLGRHMVMWSCEVYTYVHMFMKQGVWRMMLKVVVGCPSIYSCGCWWELLWIIQDVTSCMKSASHVCVVTMATVHYSPCIDMPHLLTAFISSGPAHSAQHEMLQQTTVQAHCRTGLAVHCWAGVAQLHGGGRNVPPPETLTHTTMKYTHTHTAFIHSCVFIWC